MLLQLAETRAMEKHRTHTLTYEELDILHSLRGFCAFYVVVFHAKFTMWVGGHQYLNAFPRATWNPWDYLVFSMDMLSSAGFEMVVLFFVLSGFFIRYAQLKRPKNLLNFYKNRAVRIYPPYLFSAILAAVILVAVGTYVPQTIDPSSGRELNIVLGFSWKELQSFDLVDAIRVLAFLKLDKAYIGDNGVYWSLLPEVLFYVFVPFAFWRIRLYYIISIICWVGGIVLTHFGTEPGLIGTYWCTYNIYFAIGAALYDLVTRTNWLDAFHKVPAWVLVVGSVLLWIGLLALAILKIKTLSGAVAAGLAIWWVSSLLAGRVSRQNPIIKLMHWVGIFSFSLYLYHAPLLVLCYGMMVKLTGEIATYTRYYWIAALVVTLISYGLYTVTERVSINYFRKV